MAQDNLPPEETNATDPAANDVADFITADELDALRAERDELRDRFMRALADAENSRKRAERDRREAEQYGGSRLARDLLPVFDNLKRALDAASDETRASASALIEGVELTLRELTNVLTKHGVAPIEPAIGDSFDPQQHEAMFEAPLPGTKADVVLDPAPYKPRPNKRKAGRIVFVSSAAPLRGIANYAPYVSARAAANGLVSSLAKELGRDGITVNAVAPGMIATAGTLAHSRDDAFDRVMQNQALKKRGRPEHLASLVAYLASDEAEMITGQMMLCDGGGYLH